MDETTTVVQAILARVNDGERAALDELVPIVYDTLKELARSHRARWTGDLTINTTALVHEAYLKLGDASQPSWEGRSHFLGVAAKAMRHILTDHARRKQASKRGGGFATVPIDDDFGFLPEILHLTDDGATRLIDLDEALNRLAQENPREAEVVECRFFGGMSIDETAAVLGVSGSTVKRDWIMAQARLAQMLAE